MLDMIVQVDTGGLCEYASPSIRKILGYAIDEVLGRNLLDLVLPADRRRVSLVFGRLLRNASSGTVDYRVMNAGGTAMWVESIINPLKDTAGRVTGFVVGSHDVTHRKHAEETLRLNEARLETLVDLNQMTDASADDIIEFALEEAVLLTRSALGLLAFLDEDQRTIASHVWSRRVREQCAVDGSDGSVPAAAMVADAVAKRHPIIINGPFPAAGRLPEGHAPIRRFMSVPVFDGARIVAVAGVAEKAGDYDPSDARQLTLLMEGMWMLVQRQRSQAKLRRSLEEKEVLLKEVHHRVKNNLQIISSLLNLQLGHAQGGSMAEILRESQNRIRSMALIHERLYRSDDLSRVDFGYYVRNLTSYLSRTYASTAQPVHVRVEIGTILLGVDLAIPCGLIVNELVTNAFRHAFVDGRAGEVCISMTQNESVYRLSVRDNGIGLPEGFETRRTGSLGLQLVDTLTDQINGVLEMQSAGGAEFSIVFRAS
jgi:PAS domain S-box-containing protein